MRTTRVVELELVTTHRFEIPDTNSDEEAISIAEASLEEDGDLGEIIDTDVISSTVVTTEGN